jgi:predicted component of type VI protein secretion system
MPVTRRGGHVAHAQGSQAGVEMRGPFARQQAAALRGLMQPRARLGIAAQAHQHGAVAVRDHPARGPAVRRLQRQRVKPRQRLVQHRQRGVGVTVVKVQPRPQRDEINHLGAGLRQLVGNLQGFGEAPLVG